MKISPASDWAEVGGVKVTFNNVKRGEAVYVIEGKDWSRTRRLDVQPGKPITMDFEPTEMKIFCVLPGKVFSVNLGATIEPLPHGTWLVVTAFSRWREAHTIRMPVPFEVILTDPHGRQYNYFRINIAAEGREAYQEYFPLASDDPKGKWQVRVRDLISGKTASANVEVRSYPRTLLRPAPDVQVFDEAAIHALLKTRELLVVVLGDKASDEEKAIARDLAERLKKLGVNVRVHEEMSVWRKGRYPKVFPSLEKRGDVWFDLTREERQQRRKEWERVRNWAGENGYPPSLPDAFEADDHLILVGTDESSTLIQALQRASILPRVANDYFPGKGRGFLEYAWSPFALGKDVILLTGSDVSGVRKAAERLVTLTSGRR